MQRFISQKLIPFLRTEIPPHRVHYFTILSNVFLGFAFGRIIITPAEELVASIPIKVFLVVGTCFFSSYVLSTRKAAKGITSFNGGKIRPALRESLLCVATNGFIFLLSMSLFFLKSQSALG